MATTTHAPRVPPRVLRAVAAAGAVAARGEAVTSRAVAAELGIGRRHAQKAIGLARGAGLWSWPWPSPRRAVAAAVPPRVLRAVAAAGAVAARGEAVTSGAVAAELGIRVAYARILIGLARRAGAWPWPAQVTPSGATDRSIRAAAARVAARGGLVSQRAIRSELAVTPGLGRPPSLGAIERARRRWLRRGPGGWPWPVCARGGRVSAGPTTPTLARTLAAARGLVEADGAASPADVAALLGCSARAASQRIWRLRRLGYAIRTRRSDATGGDRTRRKDVERRKAAVAAARAEAEATAPPPPDRRRARTNIEPVTTYRVATGG